METETAILLLTETALQTLCSPFWAGFGPPLSSRGRAPRPL